jgi:hypothetical protein
MRRGYWKVGIGVLFLAGAGGPALSSYMVHGGVTTEGVLVVSTTSVCPWGFNLAERLGGWWCCLRTRFLVSIGSENVG